MNDLLFHPATRRQLDDFLGAPSHTLLLVGPAGSGKRSLAVKLSETILGLPEGGFAAYPYKLTIASEDGKAIGIDAVRELEHFLSLKVPSPAAYNRVVIIEDSHLLGLEAQNALLKTLEEPPERTLIILTARSEQALLPTIRSRAPAVTIKRPDRTPTEEHFQQNFDTPAVKQAYAISGGLPGLMQALLDQSDHPLLVATGKARELLGRPVYERLLMVDELTKQRELALDVTFILQQMAHVSLQTATGPAAAKWQRVLNASYHAAEALRQSAQPKLVLTNLMLSF